jgi:hypothetical protein
VKYDREYIFGRKEAGVDSLVISCQLVVDLGEVSVEILLFFG